METDAGREVVSKQIKYQRSLDGRDMVSSRVTIPKRSVKNLRDWAEQERKELREEQNKKNP